MNILKKVLAPITGQAWDEMEEQSERVINEYRTARKIVDVDGPRGIDFGAVSTGRLQVPSEQTKSGVNIGIREVIPLVEVRKPFTLDLWELDNASRDAGDLRLDPLEKAARQMASFEDECLYYGFDKTVAPGLIDASEAKPVRVKIETGSFLRELALQVNSLRADAVEGPYALVLPAQVWADLIGGSTTYPLNLLIREITGGTILTHHANKDIFLVSERGGDVVLHLGQEIALGYENHDKEKVNLFFTESFTYQIHGPEAVRVLQPQ